MKLKQSKQSEAKAVSWRVETGDEKTNISDHPELLHSISLLSMVLLTENEIKELKQLVYEGELEQPNSMFKNALKGLAMQPRDKHHTTQ